MCAYGAEKKEDKPGLLTLLVEDCLKNPYVWMFAISYFFVYVVRQGVTSWFIFYLRVSAFPSNGMLIICNAGQGTKLPKGMASKGTLSDCHP